MRIWQDLASLCLLGQCFVSAKSGLKSFESVSEIPEGWEVVGSPDANERLQFDVLLAPESQDLLEETLRKVSSPESHQYGNYLSKRELDDLLKPSREGVKAVIDWLKQSEIQQDDIRINGAWINFVATARQADEMMGANFLAYRSLVDGETTSIRTKQVSLPPDVFKSVKLIHPTTHFVPIKPRKPEIQSFRVDDINEPDASCSKIITPKCLRDLYHIQGVNPDPVKSGFIGVPGFLGEFPAQSDLTQFMKENAAVGEAANYTSSTLLGGPLTGKKIGVEATLDIQYTVSLTYPMRNHFYSTGGRGPLVPDLNFPTPESSMNEPWLEFFGHLLDITNPADLPHTISISYGDEEQTLPESYVRAVCDQIAQLGVRGVSVLSGSGDFGPGSTCQTNDGKKTTRFLPFFPTACPYTTSVGGTQGINPERAVAFSTGGFSDIFARPWYQEEAVTGYLKKLGNQWEGLYNPKGRGFPDIAAQGSAFRVINTGRRTSVSGTSASTPVAASIIALLNAQRLQDGKPTLGFLNPWLYSLEGKAVTDIITGGSRDCYGRSQYSGAKTVVVPYASWNATKGWDPVTGIGTPLFDQMLKLLPINGTA